MRVIRNYFGKHGALRRSSRPLRRRIRLATRLGLARLKRPTLTAKVVAITGSSGKSTTTLLITKLLETTSQTRSQTFSNALPDCVSTILKARRSDEYLVFEVGAHQHGTISRMARLLKPDVAVVTMVGIEHRTVFRNKETVAQEKGALVEHVAENGFAVLNADDDMVMQMAGRTSQRIVTVGREKDADYRVIALAQRPTGTLDLTIQSARGKHRLSTNLVGAHFWLPVAAAFAVACECGVAPSLIARTIPKIKPPVIRCQPYPIEGGPAFILDTMKAPLETVTAAFEAIQPIEAPRKRIVIGMLSDYSGKARRAYQKAYKAAAEVADQVILVGEHATRHGASQADIDAGRVVEKQTEKDVVNYLRETAQPGEVILLKGGLTTHMERIALAFTHDVKCWEERCGLAISCQACGAYEYPFESNAKLRGNPGNRAALAPATAD